MSTRRIGFGIALALGLAGTIALAGAAPSPSEARRESPPVLLELFTSEGCSSCPPADEITAQIARSRSASGVRVIVLAHHVDYWNDLGWPDPFSSAEASARQRDYARLGGGSYTPQAVVDGRTQLVGSRRAAIEEAVATSAKLEHAPIDLATSPSASERDAFDVTIKVGALPEGDTDLVVAVVQDRARIAVARGENAGRTLEHHAIVRSVQTAGRIDKSGGAVRATVRQPPAIGAPDGTTFSVVAFAQGHASRRVLGAASTPLTRPR